MILKSGENLDHSFSLYKLVFQSHWQIAVAFTCLDQMQVQGEKKDRIPIRSLAFLISIGRVTPTPSGGTGLSEAVTRVILVFSSVIYSAVPTDSAIIGRNFQEPR